jgi:sugar lactone lactonase YvrE
LCNGIALALLTACNSPKAPPAPSVTLQTAADTLRAPFQDAAGAVQLGRERWAVVSEGSGMVIVADFGAESVTGLAGERTKELANPFAVFTPTGDTLWVSDWGLRRVTGWAGGRVVAAVPATDALKGALPRARDTSGRFYAAITPPAGRDGSGARDSAVVVRAASDLGRADTVARLAPLDLAEIQADGGRRFERRVFSGQDAWGVIPDGTVWIARVYQNRVDFRALDGDLTRGNPLPDRVLEVTRADRDLFLQSFPTELRRTAERLPFAPIKPPFETGFTSADGLVWLQKTEAAFDSTGRYHVVNRRGELIREIRVPTTSRILAAGDDAALAVEADSGGLLLLQYVVPPHTEQGSSR